MTPDDDVDAFASRDAQPDEDRPIIRWRAPDLVNLIADRATLPWISLRIGDDKTEIVSARAGQCVILTAASGAGKSSIAIEWAWRHANDIGPVVYVSVELDADEVGGRIVGQRADRSWRDALSARVPYDDQVAALNLPRLVVLDDDHATLKSAKAAVDQLRLENPGQPVLVVIDYLSILPFDDNSREERVRVSRIAEELRRWTKRNAVVSVVLSQTSRALASALSKGELSGAETASTGAESAQIERMAAVTVSLGGMKRREDGSDEVSISVGKGRMGQGDRVIPAVYNGRCGSWRVDGKPVSGAEHRANKAEEQGGRRVALAKAAIPALLAQALVPMNRSELRSAINVRAAIVSAAVSELLSDPQSEVCEVRLPGRKKDGARWPLWTVTKARQAGGDVVPKEPQK